jgi:hypothetical protein
LRDLESSFNCDTCSRHLKGRRCRQNSGICVKEKIYMKTSFTDKEKTLSISSKFNNHLQLHRPTFSSRLLPLAFLWWCCRHLFRVYCQSRNWWKMIWIWNLPHFADNLKNKGLAEEHTAMEMILTCAPMSRLATLEAFIPSLICKGRCCSRPFPVVGTCFTREMRLAIHAIRDRALT